MSSVITPRSYLEMRNASATADASTPSSSGITQITVTPERDTASEFFGADGPSFRDVFDAINPLNHIPVVSGMFQEATGHKPTIASQLAGGALFGPIGFVASLANVIFEQQTGKDVGSTAVAALSGETPSAVQVASNDTTNPATSADATADAAPVGQVQVASLEADRMGDIAAQAQATLAAGTRDGSDTSDNKNNARAQAVLALYGSSASGNRAYQQAQFRPYLKDASVSQVM